jgi:arylsulfatase A-like enzyme
MIDTTLHTPNIDSLVGQSIVFTNAHANAAGCGPSRASMFSGVLPQTSGHTGYRMSDNSWVDNPILATTSSVFKQFLDNGYGVYASGKIYHSFRHREEDFIDYNSEPKPGPFASNNRNHSDLPESFQEFDLSFSPLENVPSYPEYTGWQNPNGEPFFFESDENRDLLGDEMTVEYCRNFLDAYPSDSLGSPFFLSAGLYNPHQPFHAPEKYWDLYDPLSFDLEKHMPDSAIPSLTAVTNRYNAHSNQAFDIMNDESPNDDPDHYLRQYIHGYYASVSFVDDQIGLLLAGLEENGLTENTIVILTSDHGFHLGSKGLVEKSTLWNDATAVPLIIKIPGQAQQFISEPVSLVDLYPTLLEYGNVPAPESHNLDGKPLQNIISGSATGSAIIVGAARETLVVGELSEVEHNHHAYLQGSYKYIAYSSGEDELYKTSIDFRETKDLSQVPRFQNVRNLMYKKLREKIGYIRPPMPSYECLYYGDFSQDLNGWGPSETSDDFWIATNDSIFDSEHLVISGNASGPITNRNITFKSSGEHELILQGYAEEAGQYATVRVRSEQVTYLDTSFILNQELTTIVASFYVDEPLPEYNHLTLLVRSNSAFDIHIDNLYVQNELERQKSVLPCFEAIPMQVDASFSELEVRSLVVAQDQKLVGCAPATGSTPQQWQKFSPDGSTGIIGARINQYDPIIEIFDECSSSKEPMYCLNEKTNSLETKYLSGLNPDTDYFVRITSAKDLPANTLIGPLVKSLFINAKPAELNQVGLDVLDQTSSLTILDQVVFNYPVSEMTFRFEDVFSGELYVVDLDFEQNLNFPLALFPELEYGILYRVMVQYRSEIIDVEIPFGPEKSFLYQPSASLTAEFVAFPNPTETNLSTLSLQFSDLQSGEGVVSIFDLAGRKVFSQSSSIQSHRLTLSGLPRLSQGTYVVSFEGVNRTSNQELLFVH